MNIYQKAGIITIVAIALFIGTLIYISAYSFTGFPDAVALYHFDESYGINTTDSIGSNDGTINYFDSCYQETANVATSCGGLSSGYYTCSGSFDGGLPCTLGYDGDWTTYFKHAIAAGAELTIVYAKPVGSNENSLWTAEGQSGSVTNITLPLTCWNYNSTHITLKMKSDGNVPYNSYYCLNSSGFGLIGSGSAANAFIYEDSMLWNISKFVTGKVGNALSFDGVDDYVNLTTPIQILNNTNTTISYWSKTSFSSEHNAVFGKTTGTTFGYILELGHDIGFETNTNTDGVTICVGDIDMEGNWKNVVLVRNNNNVSCYVNGVFKDSAIFPINDNLTINYIGAGYSSDPYNGSIDEVGIWNRSLTQAEITDLFEIQNRSYYPLISGEKVDGTIDLVNRKFRVPSGTVFTNAYINLTGLNYSSNYPNNTAVWAGDNIIFNQTDTLDTTNRTSNFHNSLSTYVSGCSLVSGYCYVPVDFQNENGMIKYDAMLFDDTDFQFGLCNSTLTTKFLNISFKDESTDGRINATIPSSSFVYYNDNVSYNKTFSFINNTANWEYDFCATPNITIHVIPYIQYESSGYPQRTWNPDAQSYTKTRTDQPLYLLGTDVGIYVTFQVINQAEQPLSGVNVNATRLIGTTQTLVGEGTTGADGGVTFWLNPNYVHTLVFEKTGYDLYTTTITPTQASYTIALTGGTSFDIDDYSIGISYTIKPTDLYLSNDTTYNFNITLTSTYWVVDSFGFNLTNEDGTLLGSDSLSANGGTVNIALNTGTNSSIIMTYWWNIDGNVTWASKSWLVIDLGESSWSISTLFLDLARYMNSGMFGLTQFGIGLIMFFTIFIITGVFSYKYGINNYAVLVGIIWGLVALFDVGLGLIPNPIGAISHFPTWFMAIASIGMFIREAST